MALLLPDDIVKITDNVSIFAHQSNAGNKQATEFTDNNMWHRYKPILTDDSLTDPIVQRFL
jgi:hypothetical protein